jgi:hypothetical protein
MDPDRVRLRASKSLIRGASFPKNAMRWPCLVLAALVAGRVAAADADPWQAMVDARHYAELQQAAAARIAAHPDDASAWVAWTESLLRQDGADIGRQRDAALARARACVDRSPRFAACQYSAGALESAQLLAQGPLKAALGSGRPREALQRALELEPKLFPARAALVKFYLVAPGLAGGSVSKARELARAAADRQPEYAKLLEAEISADQGRPADAERTLESVQAGSDGALAEALRAHWVELAHAWLKAGDPLKARAACERVIRDKPAQPEAHYALGRVLADQRQWDDAIAQFRLAASLPGHESLPVDYRLGLAWQAKGDREQARAAFERYLAAPPTASRHVDDARKRLGQLE